MKLSWLAPHDLVSFFFCASSPFNMNKDTFGGDKNCGTKMRPHFAGNVNALDEAIGRVVDALKREMWNNIIFHFHK